MENKSQNQKMFMESILSNCDRRYHDTEQNTGTM